MRGREDAHTNTTGSQFREHSNLSARCWMFYHRFASSVWIWVLICVILSFHMCFICWILSLALGPWRRYPKSPNLCHNNTTRTTTPSVVFAQLVRLCQSVSNSLFLPLYCYSLPLFSFFALTWFVGSFVLCFASKGTSPMYPVCSLGQWQGHGVVDNRRLPVTYEVEATKAPQ